MSLVGFLSNEVSVFSGVGELGMDVEDGFLVCGSLNCVGLCYAERRWELRNWSRASVYEFLLFMGTPVRIVPPIVDNSRLKPLAVVNFYHWRTTASLY